MSDFVYTVANQKSFADVEGALKDAIAAKGFCVLHVHDVQATFAEAAEDCQHGNP